MINEEILMKNRDGCMLSLLKFNEENISVKELRNKTEVGMADEEKAEEIIKEKYCNNCEERETFPDIYNCSSKEYCDNYYLLKEGILLGLAEGKPKWHEIEAHVKLSREIEKKYMPKSNQKVMLKYHFYGDDEIHYSDGYYDCYDFEFHIPNNPTGKIICVIAWCELPKFEE